MSQNGSLYLILADSVLALHVLFVVFVVLGLVLTVIGGMRQWRWIRNLWFRLIHLAGIGVVVAQVWAGVVCPFTTLEMWLRARTGEVGYQGSFIQHWLQGFLYYDAPMWVFALVYTFFAFLVILVWVLLPPVRTSNVRDARA